jgi:homoserine kinase
LSAALTLVLKLLIMDQVTVRVPASTSNLGPGFDCLGVALGIYNHVTITRGQKSRLPAIVAQAANLFFERAGNKRFAFAYSSSEEIPRARGLGSSATIRLGVLHALNQLCGKPLDRSSIFQLCARLEGHPDNAAPEAFGGFTVANRGIVQRFQVSPKLYFVLVVPDVEIKTSSARHILPPRISRAGAIESCANACTIAAAFASHQYENLRGAFADHLHQPFREKLIPFLPRVIAAAEKGGALGAFLSGSGSSVCAITLENPREIAAAMQGKIDNHRTRVVITQADNHGARVLKIRNPQEVHPPRRAIRTHNVSLA